MKKITQTMIFKAPVHDVYELLMDSKKHSAFTGEKAVMSRKAKGRFTAYGKYISGKNIIIVKDRKIVQDWRASDWPRGTFSRITFDFAKSGNSTKMKFTQEGVPQDQFEDVKQGWKEFYWGPMKDYLKKA